VQLVAVKYVYTLYIVCRHLQFHCTTVGAVECFRALGVIDIVAKQGTKNEWTCTFSHMYSWHVLATGWTFRGSIPGGG